MSIGLRGRRRRGWTRRWFWRLAERNATEWAERAHGGEITLVILDFKMPEMGGEGVFRAIRRLRSDVRVILSSGCTEQHVARQFAGEGITGFLQKPYALAMLRETLDRVFGRCARPDTAIVRVGGA